MFSRAELKSKSEESLKGKYLKYFLVFISTTLLSTASYFFSFTTSELLSTIINLIVSTFISVFLYNTDLNIALNKENFIPNIKDSIKPFLKMLVIMFTITFLSCILMILFSSFLSLNMATAFVGAFTIILCIVYSQVFYVLIEDSSKSICTALKESRLMIMGNIKNYIFLQLSYIPKILISILTLGIALIWFLPQIQVTTANFYLYLKENQTK